MINIIVFIPIIAALLIGVVGSGKKISLLASGANLILGVFIFFELIKTGGKEIIYESSFLILETPNLALSFGVDGMSGILILLTLVVTFCAV